MNNIEQFNSILKSFKINANCVDFIDLKSVFYYDLILNPGLKLSKLEKYATEIALTLKSSSIPRFNTILNKGIVRCEFIKKNNNKISLFDLGSLSSRPSGKINCLLGEQLNGTPLWIDLTTLPHLLVAGATNSGKSTFLHVIIANLLLYPNVCLYLSDTKNIEFSNYNFNNIKISNSYSETLEMLEFLYNEMENRFKFLQKNPDKIKSLKYIVLIIDELADLKFQDKNNKIYKLLCCLAQKGRAAKINIICATQRPSVSIINGDIKANFPARISFKLPSITDSRTILDSSGAEVLGGLGDGILNCSNHSMIRFQSAYTNSTEIVKYLKN